MTGVNGTLLGKQATHVAVKDINGVVVLWFNEPTTEFQLEPSRAAQMAEVIARAAYNAATGANRSLDGAGPSQITMELRARAVTRVTLMLRSLRDQGKGDDYSAGAIVDAVLSIVT
jgi:hypothetical protein